jgi:integrase
MQDGECKMAGLTKKGKTYYALFSISGQTKWIRIGNMPLQDARIALRKLEAQYDKQKLGILELKPITLSKFSAVYLEDSRVNKAHETWKRDRTSVKTLLSFFGSHLLDSIDSKSIERYKSYRQRQGVTNRTINIELLCLSSMMKKALESNNLLSLPKIKKLKETKKPPRFLTKEELAKLIDTQNPWLRYILLVLRNTGLRSGC